ncbi:MAG: hypothetical protein OXT72_00050 [Gammaproteobacteria bacterium]|nr:hypothetical protein [Gammaproteobacteria bacterium]MDE0247623.1 hypothetical protein [Gammaproteobacteria bacterium]
MPALLFHSGALSRLRGARGSSRLLLLASHETTIELIRILAGPDFALEAREQRELLNDYLPFCETVTVPHPPPPDPGTPRPVRPSVSGTRNCRQRRCAGDRRRQHPDAHGGVCRTHTVSSRLQTEALVPGSRCRVTTKWRPETVSGGIATRCG